MCIRDRYQRRVRGSSLDVNMDRDSSNPSGASPEGAKALQIQIQPDSESLSLYHVDLSDTTCPLDLLILPTLPTSFKVRPNTRLRRLKESWIRSLNFPNTESILSDKWFPLLVFSFNGVPISDQDTATSLKIPEYAVVRVSSARPTAALNVEEQQIFALTKDIRSTQNDPDYEDVCFMVGPEQTELRASSFVCAARSKHIKARLDTLRLAGDELQISCLEHSPAAFQAMLEFLYTGKPVFPNNLEPEVLTLADEFCLDALKQLCEHRMVALLSTTTVIPYLQTASRLKCDKLQTAALEYVVDNFETVKESDSYKELTTDLLTTVIGFMLGREDGHSASSRVHKKQKNAHSCQDISHVVKEEVC
eukprot:TRINITY_DN43935_c0_g1_i2.p1 TRINITY_DN43935_c0_g1~~TRINITY_DN43935_c0_g1_i2.p1  ORF type:complete len:363 (-),score=78.25 TRINITY_DN43935_c0_g1_i2:38-1126(-)